MPTSPESTIRVSHLDVMHSRTRITSVIGPVHLPDDATIAERLRTMAEAGPHTRLGLRPSEHGSRWSFDPESSVPEVVRLDPPSSPMDLLDLLSHTSRAHLPTTVTVAGNYLRTDHNHGLGEVALTLMINEVILGMVDPADPRVWQPAHAARSGIPTAALRTFGSDPRRAWALGKSLDHTPRPKPSGSLKPWTPARTAAVVTTDPDTVQSLRTWRDRHLPSVSMFAVTAAILHRALSDAGLSVDPVATITLDARRYLPAGRVPLGNFISGLEFDLGAHPTPSHIHAVTSEAMATGRPVANLALNSVRTRIASRRGTSHAYPVSRPVNPRAQLLFSSIGPVPRQGNVPWIGGGTPFYSAHNDPVGPEGITLTWAIVEGAVATTASFHGNVFSHALVTAALEHAAADPFTLLTAVRPPGASGNQPFG